MAFVQWIPISIKPKQIIGKFYSNDVLLLVDGVVFTGYYAFSEYYLGWYIYLPRSINDVPQKCEPDGWLLLSVLPKLMIKTEQNSGQLSLIQETEE
jgi:hypothetical protein